MYATDLVEANVGGLLTEALTADVQAVLADETGLVSADTAVKEPMLASLLLVLRSVPLEYSSKLRSSSQSIPAQRSVRTIHGCPCRRCAGASTRQTRGTC